LCRGGSVNLYQPIPIPTQNTINHITHNFHHIPNKSYRKIGSKLCSIKCWYIVFVMCLNMLKTSLIGSYFFCRYEKLTSLSYAHAVTLEVLRLHPSVPRNLKVQESHAMHVLSAWCVIPRPKPACMNTHMLLCGALYRWPCVMMCFQTARKYRLAALCSGARTP